MLVVAILMILLIFPITSCSLPGDSNVTGTQDVNASQGSNSQDTAGSNEQSSTGLDTSNAGALPVENAVNTKLVKVVLFFAAQDNDSLKEEERDIQVVDGAILKACLNSLIQGPITQSLRKTIPEGTVIKGISIKDKVATVDFSKEFEQAGGAGIVARLSVVDTLTRINGIEKVRFHINGEEMADSSGMPLGEIAPASLNADGSPAINTQ